MTTQLRLHSALALALSLFAFGCPEETADGGGGAGGGGGGGDTSCDGVCSALLSQHCFYGGGMDDCLSSCNGWETEYVAVGPDYCMEAWDDYKSCITSESLSCPQDSDAHWGTIECRKHYDHFQSYCMYMNGMPSAACTENAAFDAFCSATPATPHGKSCLGDAPANCVVGGTESNSNIYCCP